MRATIHMIMLRDHWFGGKHSIGVEYWPEEDNFIQTVYKYVMKNYELNKTCVLQNLPTVRLCAPLCSTALLELMYRSIRDEAIRLALPFYQF